MLQLQGHSAVNEWGHPSVLLKPKESGRWLIYQLFDCLIVLCSFFHWFFFFQLVKIFSGYSLQVLSVVSRLGDKHGESVLTNNLYSHHYSNLAKVFIPHTTSCKGYIMFLTRPSLSQSVSLSIIPDPPFFVGATPHKPLHGISRNCR